MLSPARAELKSNDDKTSPFLGPFWIRNTYIRQMFTCTDYVYVSLTHFSDPKLFRGHPELKENIGRDFLSN
jgi:hypothetical protein